MSRIFWCLTLACFSFAGCGYHPQPQGALLTGLGNGGVHIRIFDNKSYRTGLETKLTDSIVAEFARRSGGMVTGEDIAQMLLSGTVLSYTTAPASFTAADKIREYRASIKVKAVLKQKNTQDVRWKGELSRNQVYPVNSDISLQQNAEDAAIQEICNKLALDLWQKLNEDF